MVLFGDLLASLGYPTATFLTEEPAKLCPLYSRFCRVSSFINQGTQKNTAYRLQLWCFTAAFTQNQTIYLNKSLCCITKYEFCLPFFALQANKN